MSESSVRCKFRLNSVTESVFDRWDQVLGVSKKDSLFTYVLTPVYSSVPDSENKKFWDATPSGELKFGTVRNMGLVIGRDYYLDVTLAQDN